LKNKIEKFLIYNYILILKIIALSLWTFKISELESTNKYKIWKSKCDERLLKMLDQNTRRVGHSKSKTESEQNWFSENRASLLFSPVSSFCDLFVDVPP